MARKSRRARKLERETAAWDDLENPTQPIPVIDAESLRPAKSKLRFLPLIILLLLIVAAAVGCGAIFSKWTSDLPECDQAEDFYVSEPTKVYAADRTTLLASFSMQYRLPLSDLEDAGEYAKWATVAVEDERYYDHGGVDFIGILRALVNNVTGGDTEGASTITQQLARNTVLADEATEMTVKRKVREAVVALQMEQAFSKDEILLMYMNTVNYGSGAYGIEAAAQRYFSKNAADLTLSEAALLAGIPQSPTYNNPIDYPDNAIERRNAVLDRMLANGYATQAEVDAAKAEPLNLQITEISVDGIEAYPYFTSYVRDQLTDEYGLSTSEVYGGGFTVYTTLDPTIQGYAEEAVANKLEQAGDQFECSLTAIDPDTGYIKAMVGGRDYYENQYNLAAQAKRSPGSSFKVFTLVAALEQGISPNTYVNCSSYVKISDWEVKNYAYTDYGVTTIANALAVSSNTGFARLIAAVGAVKVMDAAERMGITSELSPTLGLTLGVSTVTNLEMADAYATIANGGTHYDALCITEVYNRAGKLVVDNTDPKGTRAITPEVAHAATTVMEGVITKGTATAAKLANGQAAAGKTGTSEYEYDHWFVGITPQLSVAIWLGDPDNQQALPCDATSAFSDFMNQVLEDQDTEDFPEADDPEYTKKFNNTDLDVKVVSSWGYSSYANTSNSNTNNSNSNKNANSNTNSNSSATSDTSTDTSAEGDSGNASNASSDESESSGEGATLDESLRKLIGL